MDQKQALEIVKAELTNERYIHTIGVMETAVTLAKLFHVDVKKAEIAAIFHDFAKYRPLEEMKRIILENNMPRELLEFNSELWHAPVGAYLVQTEVGIQDEEILNAIKYHTSGREKMAALEKIIYVADYIEPGRKFPGVDEVRGLAKENLDAALLKAVQNTIQFLLKKNQPIFPMTFLLYNELIKHQ